MEAINHDGIPRLHLGPKNFYVIRQELLSHKNEYNPQTFTEQEKIEWDDILFEMVQEIDNLLSASEREQLFKEVDEMLNPT